MVVGFLMGWGLAPPCCPRRLGVLCKGCGCRNEVEDDSRPSEDSNVSSVGSVFPDCCDLVEELRLVEPHREGEYVEGDADDGAVAGVVLTWTEGDFFGVVGVVGSCLC